MSFAELPAELQIHIFSYLQAPDLKAVRGVSTKCRDNASMWLFRNVLTCARYQAMGGFQRISEHPVYRTNVREIVFDGTTYNADLARNEVLYQRSAEQFENLRGVVSWVRRTRFKKYQELYKEQENIISGHVLLQTIARALEWQMPNVSSLVYSPDPHHIPLEKKDMKEILPRGVVGADRIHDGFHHLIGAIYISQYTGIHNFKIERRPCSLPKTIGTEFYVDIFKFRHTSDLEAGKFFFQNLQKIDIALTPTSPLNKAGASGAGALECLANMATLLSEAKGLRDLSLQLSYWHPNPHNMYGYIVPHGQPIFPHLGLDTTWPTLRSLRLGGVYADEEEIKELIHRHLQTLTSLRFSHCSLFSGQWSNIVDDVVFGTNIARFVLHKVNEVTIEDRPISSLSEEEMVPWLYRGQLMVNEEGERSFKELPGQSVYAWRNQAGA